MPIIPFAEWTPDAAAYGNPGSLVIKNAVPGATSYKPFGTLTALTGTIAARPRGAIEARDKDGNVFQFAGDATDLYQLSGTTWNVVTRTSGDYTTGTEEQWEFVNWKNKVLATNYSDSPQQITFGAANFSALTTDFRARHIAIVKDFVVVGNTFDSTDGEIPHRVRWSAIDNELSWDVDPSTQSDYRDLNAGGWVQRILGGQFGLILSERSIFRMVYVGTPVIFQIDEILPGTGLLAPGAVTRLAETAYLWTPRGLVALAAASGISFPGAGKFDDTVLADLDEDHLHRISAAADPTSGRVAFAYPGAGNTNGRPNKILIYDTKYNKASIIEQELELIWQAGGVATTMEALDSISASLDALTVSLDSSQWKGGSQKLAAFTSSFASGFFDGSNMTATIDTKEMEIHSGHRTHLNAFRPLVDGATVTAQVGIRDRQSDAASFGSSLTQSASGRFTSRANARYHRFRLTLSGGSWTDAIGVQIEPHEARKGERRG